MEVERSKFAVFALVALASFIIGMAAGQVGSCRGSGHTRIDWPSPPHPRTLQP